MLKFTSFHLLLPDFFNNSFQHRPLFSVEKSINFVKDSSSNVILRQDVVEIQNIQCKVLLISDPIVFEGCSWQNKYKNRARLSQSALFETKEISKEQAEMDKNTNPLSKSVSTRKSAFLQRVNHPGASDIVGKIKKFVNKILQTPTSTLIVDDTEVIREFLDSMEQIILQHPLWNSCTEQEIEETREGLEKYVTLNLHSKLYGNREDDRVKDSLIHKTIRSLHWITLEHMEVNPVIANEKLSMELACSGKFNFFPF